LITPRREEPVADNAIANDAEILAGFAEIVKEVTAGVVKDGVTADMSFVEDLDMDSLSMVEIAVQAEDKFGVKIPDDELPNLKTVGDAVNYVSTNTNLAGGWSWPA
jgi:acyl carrier protein